MCISEMTHHLAATQWLPEAKVHPIMQSAQPLYYVSRQLILSRYTSNMKNACIDIHNVLLVRIGVPELSIACDLYLQFHDTVKIPQSYKVTHLAYLHWSCPFISEGSNSNQPRSKQILRWKMLLKQYVSQRNLLEFEIYFTDYFSLKSRLTTI